jgi:hypothetical protein
MTAAGDPRAVTPYVETNLLVAIMEQDEETVDRLISRMHPTERAQLEAHCDSLAAELAEHRHDETIYD